MFAAYADGWKPAVPGIIKYSGEVTAFLAHPAQGVAVAQSVAELYILAIQSALHYAIRKRGDVE
jgi:ureidoglycolate hydrolase